MTVKWKFDSMEHMAVYFESKGKDIRSRVPNANSEASKRTMRAEAHAYEQCAMIVRDAIIEETSNA